MKFYLVLNENKKGDHVDVYLALKKLVEEKIITSFYVYSFKEKLLKGLSNLEISSEISNTIKSYKPELILFSHVTDLKLDYSKLLNDVSASVGYWDGDIYQLFYKPLPKEILNISKIADVCFWCGFNSITSKIRKSYDKDIRYVPLSTDERFFKKRIYTPKYDVVLVGNFIGSRVPFKTFPGSRLRLEVADYFYERLKEKFAVYGNNWPERPYCKGNIAFNDQSNIWQAGRISLGINNLHAEYYYSNRLPISLSSEVIMIHNYEKNIEKIFDKFEYKYFFRDKHEAWTLAETLLEKSDDELLKEAIKYKNYIIKNNTMFQNLKYIIKVLKNYYHYKIDKVNLKKIQNPWTNEFEPQKS